MTEEVNGNLGGQWHTGYHVSPRENRESILNTGLTPSVPAWSKKKPVGVYYSEGAPLSDYRGDVWNIKVPTENTDYSEEPQLDRYSKVAIPSSDVQLVGHSVYDHTIDDNAYHEGDQDTCKECKSKGISPQ